MKHILLTLSIFFLCIATVEAQNLNELLAAADLEKGEKQFKKCVTCHSIEKGGKHKIGPNLWNSIGRKVGSAEGYVNYSPAMKSYNGNWTFELLDQYLKQPRALIPATRMNFAGIANDIDRANLIAYLRSQSDAPLPLPGASEGTKTEAQPQEKQASQSGQKQQPKEPVAPPKATGTSRIAKLALPEDQGREEVEVYCGACHSLRLVTQQRLNSESWNEVIDLMVKNQEMEPLSEADRKLVVDYLAKHFGPESWGLPQ